jgi:hypothetical protein
MARQPIPIELEGGLMPMDHRLGSNDHQCLLPCRPHLPGNHPEQAIKVTESGLWVLSFEGQKLLAERNVLQQKIALGAEKTNDQTEQKPERTEHRRFL